MRTIETIKLEDRFISEIKKFAAQKKFSAESILFYEGQIPIVAYLLLDGSIHLTKNKKIKKTLKPGSLIGLNELMTNTPARLGAVTQSECTLCFLDKSALLEIGREKNSPLAHLLVDKKK